MILNYLPFFRGASYDKSLGLVDFALHPHLDHERFPENSLVNLERLATTIPLPSYMIDDHTAIKVAGDTIEVVSEGNWKLFTTNNVHSSASNPNSTLRSIKL